MTNRRTRLPAPWRRIDDSTRKTSARYFHPNGWLISHCGHPTALWPYMLEDRHGKIHLAENGRAWRTVALAAAHVAKVGGL